MIQADIIARTHFTRKVDGKAAFDQFIRTTGLKDEHLPYEYKGETMIKSTPLNFIAESWGGYESASREWIIFIAWRSTKGNVTQYIHWTWNESSQKAVNKREHCFVG
jgi:hypothetical protein